MSKKRLVLLSIFVVFMIIFFIPAFGIKNNLIGLYSSIGKPFSGLSTSVKDFFSNIRSIQDLSNTNEQLAQKNNALEAEIAKLKEIEIKNASLREELNINKSISQKLIGAQVVSKSIVPYLQSIIIDKGSDDGVLADQAVVAQGHLAGVISEVFKKHSKVELITSPNMLIPVTLQNSRSIGILRSQLEGFFIHDIPIDDEVAIEENVVTNNLSENIPPDILIGKVDKIETYQSQIFQTISIRSPLNFQKIDFVFIVENQKP